MMITYAHNSDPSGDRYRQNSSDPVPVWATDVQLDIESYPLVEQRITQIQADSWAEFHRVPTADSVLAAMRLEYDRLGPFEYASKHNLLINNSGEEFAVQFMSVYNYSHPGTY